MADLLGLLCVLVLVVGFIIILSNVGKRRPRAEEPLPFETPRQRQLRDLNTTAEQIHVLLDRNLLAPDIGHEVLAAVQRRREELWGRAASVPVAPPQHDEEELPLFAAVAAEKPEDIPLLELVASTVIPPPPPIAEPPPSVVPELPARRWGDVLAGFMEERNILWGELVGGLLIVGCSVALVVSLWQTLQAIPYFPFLVFSVISLALFGAGQYTLHHWKLETTSRGLLVITLLLLPLNLLVLAAFAVGSAGGGVEIAVTLGSLVVFAAVARTAGREAVDGDSWSVPLAVVGSSTLPLLLPWVGAPASPWLAGLAALLFGTAVVGRLRALPSPGDLTQLTVRSAFLFLGIAGFAVGAALAFLTAHGVPARAVYELAAALTLVGVPVLLAGLLLQRRLNEPEQALDRVGATGVALVGLLILVAAPVLAWTMPGLLLGVCTFSAVVLAAIAFRLELPWAHAGAIPAAALAALTGVQLLAGHLDPLNGTAAIVYRAILSAQSGVVLCVFAVLAATLGETLVRLGRRPDALAWVLGGLCTGSLAVVLVSLEGLVTPGRTGIVYVALGTTLLASLLRWPSRLLAASGYTLLVCGSLWIMQVLDPGVRPSWGVVLATETLLLAILSLQRFRHAPLPTPESGVVLCAGALALLAVAAARPFLLEWPHSLSLLVLAGSAVVWTWSVQSPAGVWLTAVLLWAALGHFLHFVLPEGVVAAPAVTALLTATTLVLVVRWCLQHTSTEEPFLTTLTATAGDVVEVLPVLCLLMITASPASLLTLGLHLAWVAALWMVHAWSEQSQPWVAGAQLVFFVAVGYLARGWHGEGDVVALWQWTGIGLSVAGLLWVGVRWCLRRSEVASFLFYPTWPPPDRILLGVLPLLCLVGCVVGAWPILEQHYFGYRVRVSFLGGEVWVLLGSLAMWLVAALWDRDRDVARPGLTLLGLALPFVLAGRFGSSVDSFTIVTVTMSVVALLLSLPFWLGSSTQSNWAVRLSFVLLLGGVLATVVSVGLVVFWLGELRVGTISAVLVTSLVLLGHALGHRSSILLCVAGLLVNLAVALAIPHEQRWPMLAQAEVIAAVCVGLLWLRFQRRVVHSWPPSLAETSLLDLQMTGPGLAVLVMLAIPLLHLFLWPAALLPTGLHLLGNFPGWVAALVAFGAALTFSGCWRMARMPHLLGLAGLGFSVQLAVTTAAQSSLRHLPWLTLVLCLSVLGGVWLTVLCRFREPSGTAAGGRSARGPYLWSEIMALVLVVVGARGCGCTLGLPWTSAGPVLLAAVLLLALAWFLRSTPHLAFSGVNSVLVTFLAWMEWGHFSVTELVLVTASTLAVLALVWTPLVLRRFLETSFPSQTALAALTLLGSCVLIDALIPVYLAWVCLTLTGGALLVGLWDERARPNLVGLYLLSLTGVALLLRGANLSGEATLTLGTLLLTAHVILCTVVCRSARRLESRATSLASWATSGPVRSWWITSQATLAALVVVLGAYLSLNGSLWHHRAAGTVSTILLLASALHFASTLTGSRRDYCRWTVLALGPLVVAEATFVMLAPISAVGVVHHAAFALGALVLCGIVYRSGRLPPDCRADGLHIGGVLGLSSLVVLVGLMALQLRTFDVVTRRTPLSGLEVSVAALALAALLGWSLLEAMRPPTRTRFVYVAEVLLAVLFAHLRLNVPAIRQATGGQSGVQYWPFLVMGLAFAGAALGELFRRRGLDVLAVPLHRTGLALPLLPLLAFWFRPSADNLDTASFGSPGLAVLLAPLRYVPEQYSVQAAMWGMAALLLLLVALSRQSTGYTIAAALTANVALWMLLTHHGVGLLLHPQLWLIPLGVIVLVSEYANRDRLTFEQRLTLRYVGLLLLYVSSTADLFINGLGQSVWLPLVLAVLSLGGVLLGILFRVRAFLFMGVLFLLVDVLSMIWHAAVDRHQPWVWYVCGIVLGGAILALFAVFEKRRDDVVRLVEDVKRWN